MPDKDTEFYVNELKNCLNSAYTEYQWLLEKRISGRELETQIDIFGESDERIILVQFEMRREGTIANALKAVYCLEGHPDFGKKKALILHIFSPFSDGIPYTMGEEDIEIPQLANSKSKDYIKWVNKKVTRPSGRRNAHQSTARTDLLAG